MNFIKRIPCMVGLHDYSITEVLSDYAVKMKCTHCERLFAYHTDFAWALPWEKVAALYEGRKQRRAREISNPL